MKTRLITVGGFLGAGKTTLLFEVAKRLNAQGKRVGLITNDQASSLVDTAFLQDTGGVVTEVSGSCFCCNFNGYKDAILSLKKNHHVDVIIAEPVGSCTDLSATIMQPLKEHLKDELILSPLSVLIDPKKLKDILNGIDLGLHPSAFYIVKKQLEEADIIVISKSDLLTLEEESTLIKKTSTAYPLAKVVTLSAKNGEGLEIWLNETKNSSNAGNHIVDVDYAIYAEGEAVLGWLNTTVELQGETVDWNILAQNILEECSKHFDALKCNVGHVKLLIEVGTSSVIGNLTGKQSTLSIRGNVNKSHRAKMVFNARVEMLPNELSNIVSQVISSVCANAITHQTTAFMCLSPGKPTPTHRYSMTV